METKSNKFLINLLSVLLLLTCLVAGFFAWQTQKLVKELQETRSQELVTPISTPNLNTQYIEVDEGEDTTKWLSCTNQINQYSIKYPFGWNYTSNCSGFRPNQMTDDVIWDINIYSKNDPNLYKYNTIDGYLKTLCQNKPNCTSKSENYIVNQFPAVHAITTFENFYYENVFFEKGDNLYILSNSNLTNAQVQNKFNQSKNITFSNFYSTFKFIEPEASSSPVACTMDAKICSDGTSVGRTGPKCEFAPCPTPKN